MNLLLNIGTKLALACLLVGSDIYAQDNHLTAVTEIIRSDSSVEHFGTIVLYNMDVKIQTLTEGNACMVKPVSDSTIFNIASCTKTYVATLVLLLQEEGKLKIDDPVNKYLSNKEMPGLNNSVTIRHLLNHTSGLPDFSPTADYIDAMLDSSQTYDKKDIFRFLEDSDSSQAGGKFSYNNVGYVLLGLITERVSQLPLDKAIEQYIGSKVDLGKTYFHFPSKERHTACPGYELLDSDSGRRINYINMDNLSYAAGNIYTTAHDLDRFVRALFIDKTILSSPSLEEMQSVFKFNQKSENGMGLGVFVTNVDSRKMYSHTGRYLMGYTSAYACFPELNYSVVIFRNNIILDYSKKSNLPNKILSYLIKNRVLKE